MGWISLPPDISVDELSHYGAKGQKWGRRRWQNPDGSYTEAGRRHYGIGLFNRKRKMSKDAQMRAKERVRAKNEAARQEAFEAEARRAMAETEAERAKTALREAKKQNSLAYKVGSKAASAAANKMAERKAEREANKPLSKNAEKYIAAIQSGNKRQIKKFANKLNNDEYRKAVDRINMQYQMNRLADDDKIARGRQKVDKLRNVANALTTGVDVWNAGAGIISAFSGANVPKINTKYEDPIDRLKKQLEYETKKEGYKTAVAGTDKARAIAKQETIKADTALKDYYDKYPEEKAKAEARAAVEKEASTKKSFFSKKEKSESKKSDWKDTWREESEKAEALAKAKKNYSYEPEHKTSSDTTVSGFNERLNALTGGGYSGQTKTNVINVNKKTKINDVKPNKKTKNLVNGYRQIIGNTSIEKVTNAFNTAFPDGDFDVSKLSKKQQQAFFAILNGLK